MTNKIQVSGLYKSFNQQEILKGVDLSAKKGDVIALLGSSGSGKSTLLRCINLLTIPDAGVMQIDQQVFDFNPQQKNQKINSLKPQQITALRTKIGMVFQQFNLWAHMSVLENLIEAPIQVLKQDKATTIIEAKQLLAKVGLQDKQNAYPQQLSGGQQQRAAIARALMMKPEIMLFDEPTSALDPLMVGEVMQVMQTLANEGMTMIIATHELNFAKQLATTTIFLEGGKIIEQGPTRQMFTAPTTDRFKQFLAAMSH